MAKLYAEHACGCTENCYENLNENLRPLFVGLNNYPDYTVDYWVKILSMIRKKQL